MNLFEGHGNREAKIRYLDGDFQILMPGSYVLCAMTGDMARPNTVAVAKASTA